MEHARQFVLGAAVSLAGFALIPILVALGSTPAGFVTIFVFVGGLLNLVMWAPMIGVFVYGLAKERVALSAAPVVLLALWISASVLTRIVASLGTPSDLFERELPETLGAERTLIINPGSIHGGSYDLSLLANGQVDRIVGSVWASTTSGRTGITAMTLERGADCQGDTFHLTRELWAVGRIDECFVHRELDSLPPDGWRLASRLANPPATHAEGHCCWELHFVKRENGIERVVHTWRWGGAQVLSYLPALSFIGTSSNGRDLPSVWGTRWRAPVEPVYLGEPPPRHDEVVAAVYGVEVKAPFLSSDAAPEALLSRAFERLPEAINAYPLRRRLRELVIFTQSQGLTDHRSFEIMATAVGDDWHTSAAAGDQLQRFGRGLTPEERARYKDVIIDFIGNESYAESFNGGETGHIPLHREPPARILELFRDRPRLGAWQYQTAAQIYLNMRAGDGEDSDTIRDTRRRQLFAIIEADQSDDVGARAAAYCGILRFAERDDRERLFIANNLWRMTDRQFKSVVLDTCMLGAEPATKSTINRLVHERAELVRDPQIRERLASNITEWHPHPD